MIKRKKNVALEFRCTRCSLCCREEGYVLFSRTDIDKAAKYLNLTKESFAEKYLTYSEAYGFYIEVKDSMGCILLSDNNDCIIQNAKPEKCSTFPYWSEYVDADGKLSPKKFDRPCPGVFEKK